MVAASGLGDSGARDRRVAGASQFLTFIRAVAPGGSRAGVRAYRPTVRSVRLARAVHTSACAAESRSSHSAPLAFFSAALDLCAHIHDTVPMPLKNLRRYIASYAAPAPRPRRLFALSSSSSPW